MRAMRSSGTLLCLASGAAFGAMAIFGKLAYGEGATRRHAARRPLRARRGCCSGRCSPPGARAAAARCRAATSRAGLALGAVRLRAPGRLLLRRAASGSTRRCSSLLLYTFPAIVAVAAVALGRERLDARRRGRARARLGRLRARRRRRGRGRARPARRGARRSRAAVVYSAYILVSERRRGARARRASLAALVCTGAAVSLAAGVGAARRVAPGRADRRRLGLDRLPRGRLDGRRDRPVLRRPAARRPDDRVDPRDRRAARHRAARVPRRSARRSRPLQLAGGALVLAAVVGPARVAARARPARGRRHERAARRARSRSSPARPAAPGAASPSRSARRARPSTCTGRSTRERRSEVDRPETIEETAELVTAAGGEGIAVAVDHLDPDAGRARSSRGSTPSRAGSTCSSTTSGAPSTSSSGTRRSGSTTSTTACGCCASRSTRT